MRSALCVVATGWVLASAPSAHAHESRPLYVEIIEQEPLLFSVQWKTPPSVPSGNAPEVTLPPDCELVTPKAASPSGRRGVARRTYRCAEDPSGRAIGITYPVFNPSVSTLVRISWHSGQSHSLLGAPDETSLEIPARESFGGVAKQYLALGARHILGGYDHLLFLVCLLLIAGTARRILITITGFTIAHSITLALSALHVVQVPIAPVEAAIALSIVFLAVEIVRGDENSLTYRYPIAVASTFGLLHGVGFAAVLGETGLPQTEIPAALLFFNVGVELGQIAFVLGVIVAYQALRLVAGALGKRRFSLEDLRPFETPTAYLVGSLASFWMIARIAGFG
ncbi:MAG: HupE/UreJ family protein [Deltaproteobacteria bacterium]|nr:HupE/UreJ family protein [Deltaproteobacteria bacterium]